MLTATRRPPVPIGEINWTAVLEVAVDDARMPLSLHAEF
jgi:hypothetical protein